MPQITFLPFNVQLVDYQRLIYSEIEEVYCYAENVPSANSYIFDDSNIEHSILYVPTAAVDQYKTYRPWKEFKEIRSIAGDATDHKCQTPTIAYENGKLTFSSETEDAEFYYVIQDSDISQNKGSEVQLIVTYNIKVYATKTAWENSDPAYATLCWIDEAPKTEGIAGSVSEIRSNAVLIQSAGEAISISGAAAGSRISVYKISGELAGSAIAGEGTTTIAASLGSDKIAIVKIADKAMKIFLR